MKRVSENDLLPWADPDALVDALLRIPREELASLRESLLGLTEHEDRDVRTHAIRRLFVHLQDQDNRHIAIQALTHDAESHVRRAAAFGVAATSSSGTRTQDVSALAARLRDVSEDVHVRGAAYEALLLIHGRRACPPLNRAFDPARDVDWEWVGQLDSERT